MIRSNVKTVARAGLAMMVVGAMQINGFSSAYAQTSRVGVGGMGNVVTVVPGTYENINIGATEFLSTFKQMNAEDSAWMRSAVGEINESVDKLKDMQIKLVNLASESATQSPLGMDLQAYLKAVNPVRIELQALRTKIEVLTAVPSARNEKNVAKLESGKMTVVSNGAMQSIDITGIKKIMTEKMSNVEASINEITFYIHALNPGANDSPRTEQKVGAVLASALTKNFTGDQINKMVTDANAIEKKAKSILVAENDRVSGQNLQVLKTLIDDYGVKDRFQIRKNDTAGLASSQKQVTNMYFARSVLRYVYAVPVGAFGTPDTRRTFSFQQVPLINSNKIEINESILLSQEDLMKARHWIFVALQTQNDWAGNNNGKGLLERLSNPLSNLSNLINFVSFREGWSKLNAFVLQNMLNEVEEELAMNEPAGLLAVRTRVNERIKASSDPVATKKDVANMIEVARATSEGRVVDGTAIGAGGNNDTLKTIATSVGNYLTKINESNALRKQAAVLRQESNAFGSGQAKRANDLLD